MKRLAAILAAGLLFTLSALPAAAQTDVVRELNASYDIRADGSIDVTWEVDWDLGQTGRRGIIIDILTREPWELDGDLDAVYDISDLQVTSPTGAPDVFTESSLRDGEYRYLEVRVGDPNSTLDESRHTYVLSYTIEGALRTFDGQPEFFWDVTSADFPQIDQATVSVSVPGGVSQARCLVDDRECTSTVEAGVATFTAEQVAAGEPLSVVAAFEAGQVDNAEPTLVEAEADDTGGFSPSPPGWRFFLANPVLTLGVLAGAAALISGVVSWFRRPRDERYEGVPPGVINSGGPTTTKKFTGPIPVRFEPPQASLVEAGQALHGAYDPSHLAATIVQMAVDKTLEVSTDPLVITKGQRQETQDPVMSAIWHQAADPGASQPTGESQLNTLAQEIQRSYPTGPNALVKQGRKFGGGGASFVFIIVIVAIFLISPRLGLPSFQLIFFAFLAFFLVTVMRILSSLTRAITGVKNGSPGLRTARGSAIRDQTLGFKQYIETAEAGQLNFEADQDIFRRYLPWAVLFGLTDRWTRICQDLADMGRIRPVDYSFIRGAHSMHDINRAVYSINSNATSAYRAQQRAAAARRASSSSWGGGSGGRSGFSSGSRGGGGGGGSRGRSW